MISGKLDIHTAGPAYACYQRPAVHCLGILAQYERTAAPSISKEYGNRSPIIQTEMNRRKLRFKTPSPRRLKS